jgi:hypothetical protein
MRAYLLLWRDRALELGEILKFTIESENSQNTKREKSTKIQTVKAWGSER